jgi:hypothetical protein
MKIPLKTKIFMWYLKRGVILTKDNLARRNWNGIKHAIFVVSQKLSNTTLLNVIMKISMACNSSCVRYTTTSKYRIFV